MALGLSDLARKLARGAGSRWVDEGAESLEAKSALYVAPLRALVGGGNMLPDLGRALIDGIEVFEAVGVRYAMVGALAVSAWSTPRATGDADLYTGVTT